MDETGCGFMRRGWWWAREVRERCVSGRRRARESGTEVEKDAVRAGAER